MSHLQYGVYPGHGEAAANSHRMSQAVRIPPGETITISGQGGWDRANGQMATDLSEEYSKAFDNVDYTLTLMGGKGLSQVYKLVFYYTSTNEDAMKFLSENMIKRFPDHRPIVTAIGVEKLALTGMNVEIEAWAHLN